VFSVLFVKRLWDGKGMNVNMLLCKPDYFDMLQTEVDFPSDLPQRSVGQVHGVILLMH